MFSFGFGMEAHINWSMVTCKMAAPVTGTTLRTTGPVTLLAIGTQLRDPMNSGLIRWRMAVYINKWTPPRKSGRIP